MDIHFGPEDEAFREEVRTFFREKFPKDLREKVRQGRGLGREDVKRWQRIVYEQGWVAPKWPIEYGGPGWTPAQRFIWDEEYTKAGLPPVGGMGVSMIGPIILKYGNPEQKGRFLEKSKSGEITWCQGYSEPGSGSDLASLKTRAVRDGEVYVVNGQKIWTSGAHMADWIFALVRTSEEDKRQLGITMLLIDMKTPGIEVRPIVTIDGGHHVNEVFFTDVRVPVENRVGEEGRGWTYAKVLLQNERTGQARIAASLRNIARLRKIAGAEPGGDGGTLIDDPAFRRRVDEIEIDLRALQYSELQTLADSVAGRDPGPGSSYLKTRGTEIQQSIQELYVQAAGYYANPQITRDLDEGSNLDPVGQPFARGATRQYLFGRAMSIYGGTNEIQRNVMAKAVLGL